MVLTGVLGANGQGEHDGGDSGKDVGHSEVTGVGTALSGRVCASHSPTGPCSPQEAGAHLGKSAVSPPMAGMGSRPIDLNIRTLVLSQKRQEWTHWPDRGCPHL